MGNNSHYWKRKDELSQKAHLHTEEMERLYKDSIEYSVENSEVYVRRGIEDYDGSPSDSPTKQLVYPGTTHDAIFVANYYERDSKIAVLNFASYKNPGGKFLEGSSAQEESLCHVSTLYPVLKRKDDFYEYNRNHLNRGLYEDRLLYSPSIRFFFNSGEILSDVLTCAAPNLGAYLKYNDITAESRSYKSFIEENSHYLRNRMELMRYSALDHDVDVLILGAWGCGVFQQNPKIVARAFDEVFKDSGIPKIIYAVPDIDDKFRIFKEIISQE